MTRCSNSSASSKGLRSIVGQVATIPKQQRVVYEDAVTSVCTFLERGHGILVKLTADQFDFAHNMLREVMAGRALGRLPLQARREFALQEAWAGPIRYWAGLIAAENKFEISAMIDELERDVQAGSITAAIARAEMLVEVCLVIPRAELTHRLQQQIASVTEELAQSLSRQDLARASRVRIGDLRARRRPIRRALCAAHGHQPADRPDAEARLKAGSRPRSRARTTACIRVLTPKAAQALAMW